MKKGFSIIEVMIFTTLMTVVLLAMTGYTMRLLYTMKINEHKMRANVYADEVKEWLIGERESSFKSLTNFYGVIQAGYTNTPAQRNAILNNPTFQRYCLNSGFTNYSALSNMSKTSYCGFNGLIPAIYKRELFLISPGMDASQVYAIVRVSWMEGNQLYSTTIDSVYFGWE